MYLRGAQTSQNLRSTSYNFNDTAGTTATPVTWAGARTEAFGYTSKDSSTGTTAVNPAANKFIAVMNSGGAGDAVMATTSAFSGSGCVTYGVSTSGSTQAGTYAATIIYTAVPSF